MGIKTAGFLSIILFSFNSFAQAPVWTWAKSFQNSNASGYDPKIAIDASGNIYTTGTFSATVPPCDFDPGPGVFNLTSTFDAIFISKLDASGNFVWVKKMDGTSQDEGCSISVDVSTNLIVTGRFTSGVIDFDPGLAVYSMNASTNDMFICKFDSGGNFIWAKELDGINGGYINTVDIYGNLYLIGEFSGTADFDPGPGIYNLSGGGGFICKLDNAGNFVWAKGFIGTVYPHSIVLDAAGNIYTAGGFQGTPDFDPGPGIFNLMSVWYTDIFVSKLDSSGNFIWAKGMGGNSADEALSLDIDALGNIYTTGYFTDTVDFDPGPGIFNLSSNPGSQDFFVFKLDHSGNFIWAHDFSGGTSYGGKGKSIKINPLGNEVYISGCFRDTVDFDPGPGIFNLISPTFQYDAFIYKLDTSGNFVWAKRMGGPAPDYGAALVLDSSNNICLIGGIGNSAVVFDSITLTGYSSIGNDIFIAKLTDDYIPTGRSEMEKLNISVYPNLTHGEVTLLFNKEELYEIYFYNTLGKILEKIQIDSDKYLLKIGNYPQGIYFLVIRDKVGNEVLKKVVKM